MQDSEESVTPSPPNLSSSELLIIRQTNRRLGIGDQPIGEPLYNGGLFQAFCLADKFVLPQLGDDYIRTLVRREQKALPLNFDPEHFREDHLFRRNLLLGVARLVVCKQPPGIKIEEVHTPVHSSKLHLVVHSTEQTDSGSSVYVRRSILNLQSTDPKHPPFYTIDVVSWRDDICFPLTPSEEIDDGHRHLQPINRLPECHKAYIFLTRPFLDYLTAQGPSRERFVGGVPVTKTIHPDLDFAETKEEYILQCINAGFPLSSIDFDYESDSKHLA